MSAKKDNTTSELPKGWSLEALSDIADVVGGGTPSTTQREYWGNDIVWLSPTDLPAIGEIVEVNNSAKKISKVGLENSSAKLLPVGAVVYSSRASIGKIGITTVPLATNQGFTNFICTDDLNNKYLAFALRHFTEDIAALSNSTTFAEVSKTNLKNFKIPIPKPIEQQRIVNKLDAIFEKLDAAVKQAQENLEHLSHLLPSALSEVFEMSDMSKWNIMTLQDMLDNQIIVDHLDGNHGSLYPRKEDFVASGVQYISANCIDNGKIDFSKAKYLTIDKAKNFKKGRSVNKDVLFAHNATVGPVAILETKEPYVILGTSLTYYRCNQERLNHRYLYFYLKSSLFINQYTQVMGQATRNQVPITKQREFTHYFPKEVSLQTQVADYLEQLELLQQQLQQHYKSKLKYLRVLKASLLDAAFKGDL